MAVTETAGHFRDSGTVQMSHSSVSGVRSKSFIRLWISGKYSLEDVAAIAVAHNIRKMIVCSEVAVW